MSGHIVNLNDANLNKPVHQTVQELLPWFAAETLGEEDRALVDAHLQACEQCRSDLEWERSMLAAEPESNLSFDMEGALARLQPRLETSRVESIRSRFSRFLGRMGRRETPWMQWALAAQSAAIVILAGVLAFPRVNPAPYQTLGLPQNTTANMVVMFEPDTSEQDLRRMLQASSARIMDGPTVTDAYLLSVPAGRLAAAVRMLRAEKHVKLAEPLVASGEKP
jgi:predicted anti-sigma-YlaC factor YlaD